MTKASQELETRRMERTFAELSKAWWWFDPANASEKCEASLAWETLRRTTMYPALWRKCQRERSHFRGDHANPSGAEFFRLAHLFSRTKAATSELCFRLVMDGFDWNLAWLELTERQRLTMQGYVIADGEAVKANSALTLPRQTAGPHSALSISLCQINRDAAGNLVATKLTDGAQDVARAARHAFFQTLKLAPPASCLCVYFDTRLSRETLLTAMREHEQSWTPDPHSGGTRLKLGDLHVIPSDEPAFAILLAPATCGRERLAAAFHTQLKYNQRRKWHRRCVEHWKTLKVEVEIAVRNPDDSIPLDSRGFPIKETVSCPLFDPAKHLPPKHQPAKSARRGNLWLGLAADDVVRAGGSLFKTSTVTQKLIEHCGAWRAYCKRAGKTGKQDFPAQRKALQESRHELRNHQRSARTRLIELNRTLGRLDKNLDHWLKENERLARAGAFFAAALRPASKPSAAPKLKNPL